MRDRRHSCFQEWPLTGRCLRSLFACDPDVALQVVVVDDGSTDATQINLASLPGVEVVCNGDNRGFVDSCNRGAALARGRFILFLNNDTQLQYGALRSLVRRMTRSERIGVVGSKLIYPDGRLQEAGNIVWSDASGWNYGRSDVAEKYEYNFTRDVDYVSGASLLISNRAIPLGRWLRRAVFAGLLRRRGSLLCRARARSTRRVRTGFGRSPL